MIRINFKGVEYKIPDSKAFEAGEAVENVVTLAEMHSWGDRPKFFVLARALGALLRFAGAKVSDKEVKRDIDQSLLAIGGGDEARQNYMMSAMEQLQAVLFDGAPEESGDAVPEKAKASSRPRSKKRS